MKKTFMAAGVVAAVGLASVYGAGVVSAAQTTDSPKNQSQPFKTEGLKEKTSYQKPSNDVITKDHDSKKLLTNVKDDEGPSAQFDKFVTQGKITQAQANQLKAKFAEVENLKQSFRAGMTETERDAIVRASVNAFTQWAATQHFPAGVLPTFVVHDGSDGQRHGLEIGFDKSEFDKSEEIAK